MPQCTDTCLDQSQQSLARAYVWDMKQTATDQGDGDVDEEAEAKSGNSSGVGARHYPPPTASLRSVARDTRGKMRPATLSKAAAAAMASR